MKHFEYSITDDKEFIFTLFDIPGALLVEFPELYADALKGGERIIRRLKTLVKQYPHVPQLVNYLSVALHSSGRQEEGYALNRQLVAEHPDYLFGKLNLAHEYFRKEGCY